MIYLLTIYLQNKMRNKTINSEDKLQAVQEQGKVSEVSLNDVQAFVEGDNITEFHTKEEEALTLNQIYLKGKKKGEKSKSHFYAKEMARQQHRALPTQGNLFDFLNPEAKKHAVQLNAKGKLLSSLVEGIDGGGFSTKVIIALMQVLSEQNNLFDEKEIQKNSQLITEVLQKDGITTAVLRTTRTAGAVTKYDKVDEKGYPLAFCPYVVIRISDFTRRVIGNPTSKTIRKEDRDRVRDTLDELSSKELFYTAANGHFRSIKLIGKHYRDIDPKTKDEIRILELDGIFLKNIEHDFLKLPSDILQRFRGNQSKLTMRLFWYLAEQRSLNKRTYPKEKKTKSELFSEIAIIERYKDHPKEKQKDYEKALEVMKKIRLITDDYKEEQASNGELICIFTFREDFEKIIPE